MSSKTIIVCAVLICSGGVAAYYLIPNGPTSEPGSPSILVDDDALIPGGLSDAPTPASESAVESPVPSTASLTELEAELASTALEREKIEEALRVVELKVGALEAQLDDIELRGDNPADVQDETLDSFQVVFAEFQDAIKAVEEIEAKQEWLIAKILEIKE